MRSLHEVCGALQSPAKATMRLDSVKTRANRVHARAPLRACAPAGWALAHRSAFRQKEKRWAKAHPTMRSLFRRRRLPQLDAIAVRIHDPAELAILAFVDLRIDLHASATQCRKQRMQIIDTEIHHERLVARLEVVRVLRERHPERGSRPGRVLAKLCAAESLDLQTQMLRVPRRERLRIASLEEDAAQTGNACHNCLLGVAATRILQLPALRLRAAGAVSGRLDPDGTG